MKKKVLITGVSGFAGSYLAEYLVKQDCYDIHGTYLIDESLQTIVDLTKHITVHKVDLTNESEIVKIIQSLKPQVLYHLAALASPAESFKHPAKIITNNITAQVHILEAIRQFTPDARVLIVSSAEVYGNVKKNQLPINEAAPFAPTSPYAVSKVAQDMLGLQYFLSYKIPIMRVRPFNHIGPRQSDAFVVSALAKKIAQIEKGIIPPVLRVGNLEPKRDFTDVRDTVCAYTMILEKGTPGEVYNIGSGIAYSIHAVVTSDNTKIHHVTGWSPHIPLDQSLAETLDYWRSIV